MNRKQRTKILVDGPAELAAIMARQIGSRYEVKAVEEPGQSLVMVKARETTQNSLFYLGEMLVTECKVQIDGCIGIGIIRGDEPERAYDLAVIDAAYAAGLAETSAWSDLLRTEAERMAAAQRMAEAKLLKTKVHFETMVAEGGEQGEAGSDS